MVLADTFFKLSTLDLVVFFGSLVTVMLVGLLAARHERDARDYFLAGKSVRWWGVAGSIFGSNISSNHLVGMTGIGLSVGFAGANYEFGAVVGLLVLCFLFLPIYRRLNVYTLSEYLEHRFDRRCLVVYSVISMFVLIVLEMVATLYIGSTSLEVLFGLDYRWGVVLVAIVTGVYTILGGLKAVIWTDVLQSILLLMGGLTVAYYALSHDAVGGIGGMLEKDADRFHVFFNTRHPELPWLGVLTGLMILHFNYWGANQFIVQRALGARSNWDGRTGIILAGFLKLGIPFITFLVGMSAAHLIAANAIPAMPTKPDGSADNDMVFPIMVRELLPKGLVGLALAGLIGAILSTVDSMMNSAATLFTFDFYKRYFRPAATERELVNVGRVAIAASLVISCVITVFIYDPKGSFFLDLGNKTSFVAVGVIAAFLCGITWKGATKTAAFTTMLVGPILSAAVVLLWNHGAVHSDWIVNTFSIAVDGQTQLSQIDPDLPVVPVVLRPFAQMLYGGSYEALPQFNWFYRTFIAFALCILLLVMLSRLTRHERRATDEQMVWTGVADEQTRIERAARPTWQDERIWAAVLIALDIALCIRFA